MPRIKELVRIATLERHFKEGLVAAIEIIDVGECWIVCVRYAERAEGEKKRFITSKRSPGAKRFASFSTAWKVLNALGIEKVVVRKATSAEQDYKST